VSFRQGSEGEQTGVYVRRELAELVAHHLLGNGHVMVDLAVVHLELKTNEVGQNGCRSRLGPDWRNPLSWLRPHDGESRQGQLSERFGGRTVGRSGGWEHDVDGIVGREQGSGQTRGSYGTMCGPKFKTQSVIGADSGRRERGEGIGEEADA
jgi:hypothetical protein